MTPRPALVALLAALALPAAASAKGTAYVVGMTDKVAAESIGPAGALTPVAGSPFATGGTPRSVAISPDARHVYVSNFGTDSISAYTAAASGALSPVAGSPFATGTDPEGIAISPDGQFLFAPNQGAGSVTAFQRNQDTGALAPVAGSPFALAGVAELAVSPDGRFLLATVATGVQVMSISAAGALSPVGPVVPAGTTPKGIAVTPNGGFAFVGNAGSSNVSGFAIGADGALTPLGATPAGNVPQTLAISQNGGFLYVANFTDPGTVNAFSIGATGVLTALGPTTAGKFSYGADSAPDGRLYVANFVDALMPSTVSVFGGADGGALSPVSGSPFTTSVNGAEYQSIAITPNQGPTAALDATPRTAGTPSEFSGAASTDPDGTVARYDWDFGDGTTLPNGGPTPTHAYAQPGSYTVALTVTDDEGCSTFVVFTGQTADCNGSATARATRTVEIGGSGTPDPDPDPDVTAGPELRLSARRQRLRRYVVVRARTSTATRAVATGRLRVKAHRRHGGRTRSYKLKRAKANLRAGRRTKLKLKLSRRTYRKVRRTLRKGGRAKAKVTVRVTDATGRKDRASVRVKLRRR